MKPTIGRIVHFHSRSFTHAAIVTAVYDDGVCDLTVFVPGVRKIVPLTGVTYSEEPTNGCWSWPPRVAP